MNPHTPSLPAPLSQPRAVDLVRRYIQLWNQPDARLRREAIATLWADDGLQFVRAMRWQGHAEIFERVTASHDKNVAGRGFIFRRTQALQVLQDSVMFQWHMLRADGSGLIEALGMEFMLLAPDGRIRADYQFILPTPQLLAADAHDATDEPA